MTSIALYPKEDPCKLFFPCVLILSFPKNSKNDKKQKTPAPRHYDVIDTNRLERLGGRSTKGLRPKIALNENPGTV